MSLLEAAVAYRLLTSRAVLTGPDGLEGIDTHPINQGSMVLAAGAIYRLDRDSSAVADGVTVLAPVLGPGRWLFVAASGGATVSVTNLAALAALGVASPDLVWVDTLLCYWHRYATSVLAPDGITVVAAVGGGNWERIVPTTAPDWLAQAAWTIDPLLGDDENAGGALAPLASFDELNRRLSVGELRQNTTVEVVSGATIVTSTLSVDTGAFNLTIQGQPTSVYSGTIATYTARSHVVPEAVLITDAGVADWTPYAGMRLRITSGASAGAISWIAKANPAGAGLNVARASQFSTFNTSTLVLTAATPVPGVTFEIETLPDLGNLNIYRRNPTGILLVSSVSISGGFFVEGGNSSFCAVDGCYIGVTGAAGVYQFLNAGYSPISNNGMVFVGRCGFLRTSTSLNGGCAIRYSMHKGALIFASHAGYQYTFSLGDGSTSGISVGTQDSSLSVTDSQLFDFTVAAFGITGGCNVFSRSGLSGSGNVIGLLVGGTSASLRRQGMVFGWMATADLPNLLGTTTPIRIAGSTDINLTWAQVPFNNDEQRGVGTLVDGTATIAARNANLRPPTATHATLAGTAVGTLTIPTATLTSSQFVVNSVNAAGALVDDDSTFNWSIPGMFRNVTIAQLDSNS